MFHYEFLIKNKILILIRNVTLVIQINRSVTEKKLVKNIYSFDRCSQVNYLMFVFN